MSMWKCPYCDEWNDYGDEHECSEVPRLRARVKELESGMHEIAASIAVEDWGPDVDVDKLCREVKDFSGWCAESMVDEVVTEPKSDMFTLKDDQPMMFCMVIVYRDGERLFPGHAFVNHLGPLWETLVWMDHSGRKEVPRLTDEWHEAEPNKKPA